MGKIFIVMGKSAVGKDTIYQGLLELKELNLQKVVPYTTRPIRNGENHGKEYFFVNEEVFLDLNKEGKIIENRHYNTVKGLWRYFTVDDGQINLEKKDYLIIGTLEAYLNIRDYFGTTKVIPIYIEIDDIIRIKRAIDREEDEKEPQIAEMCRRYLADSKDFSDDKIKMAGITKTYGNNKVEDCIKIIAKDIKTLQGED